MTDSINVPTKGACTDGFAGYVITPEPPVQTGEASPEMTELVRQVIDAAYEWGCAETYSLMEEATPEDEGKAIQKEKGVDIAEDRMSAAIAALESTNAALIEQLEASYDRAEYAVTKLKSEIAALSSQLAECRRDSERLDWLEAPRVIKGKTVRGWQLKFAGDTPLRPVIDAAMRAAAPPTGDTESACGDDA